MNWKNLKFLNVTGGSVHVKVPLCFEGLKAENFHTVINSICLISSKEYP
jgi:hypothetical protein